MRFPFPKATLKLGWVALLALAIQAIAIFAPLGFDDTPKRLLFVTSYLILLVFIVVNLPRPGLIVIGVGVILNFLPIVTNGGLMPVTAASLAEVGRADRIEGLNEGDAIPYTKNVLKTKEKTRFFALSDRIVWDNPVYVPIVSIGDVVVAGGLVVMIADLFLPRVRREARPTGASRANL